MQELSSPEGRSSPLRAPSGKKRGTLNSRLGSLPGNSQARNSWLGWQSGTFCRCRLHVRGAALKISCVPAPSPCRLPRARSAVPPWLREAVAAALPVGFARRGGQQMEGALHPFFSIFNPAARSWGGAVEEKGGAFRKAALKPRLWHSGMCLIHRTGEQDCVCRLDPTAWARQCA